MSQLPAGSYKPMNDISDSVLGWEIPVESVPLPSCGVLYDENSFFYKKEMVNIKAMTAKEEDILSSRAFSKEGTTIQHLIASCTGAPLRDVNRLLLGDRNALLISIRVTGYGVDYNANVTCPACQKTSEQQFDLSQLEIGQLDINPVKEGENIFEYSLPVSKKIVHFRFFNAEDESAVDSQIQNMEKMLGSRSVGRITTRLFNRIVSIDGITDRDKIKKFVDIMPAFDSKSLRNFISDLEPKINTEVSFKCKHCLTETMIMLPIGKNFFWPA
jgi:hypothetical protein